MKQKKPGKKLIFNKKTIAVLDSRQLKVAYGGETDNPPYFCDHCEISQQSCPPTEDPTIKFVCCF